MTEEHAKTKAELLAEVERAWQVLNNGLDGYAGEQLTGPKDDAGWAASDHITHMAFWERSVIFLLQGKPRHEGLGVEKAIYRSGDEDAINDAIFKQHRSLTAAEAREKLRQTHEELIAVAGSLSDADLYKRYHDYLPDEPDDDRPVINVVYGNTVYHFPDHLEWIDTLIKRGQG